jgi:hypothetical protein
MPAVSKSAAQDAELRAKRMIEGHRAFALAQRAANSNCAS